MIPKWLFVVILFIIILGVLYLTGKKSVHHEISINATPEKVWNILTDMDSYDEWNPVMKLLQGEIKKGGRVTYRFTQDADNQSEIPATVIKIETNKLLNQAGGIPLILRYNHKYILEVDNSKTKVIIHEDYQGIGVHFWNPKTVEMAYERLNKALKVRVESIN